MLPYEGVLPAAGRLAAGLADFCRLPSDALAGGGGAPGKLPAGHDKWQQELDPAGQQFLTQFFSERRRQQWPLLEQCLMTRPIFVTGSQRSGTSWLASVLAAGGQVAFWTTVQPLNSGTPANVPGFSSLVYFTSARNGRSLPRPWGDVAPAL